VIPPDQ
jgi:ubiquitin